MLRALSAAFVSTPNRFCCLFALLLFDLLSNTIFWHVHNITITTGGGEFLTGAADGGDATAAFEDTLHSSDATVAMRSMCIGVFAGEFKSLSQTQAAAGPKPIPHFYKLFSKFGLDNAQQCQHLANCGYTLDDLLFCYIVDPYPPNTPLR